MKNIEIKKKSKTKEITDKLKSKLEDSFFSIIEKLPERMTPGLVMNWMERYLSKRLAELKHEQVKGAWRQLELEKVVNEIREK